MKKLWTEEAWEDYLRLQKQDKRLLKKVNDLIRDAERTPFEGTGKPEPLKGCMAGYWSRRVTEEHRLVYRVTGGVIEIYSCKGHYDWNF